MSAPGILSNDNGDCYVPVAAHTDETRLSAADEAACYLQGYTASDSPAAAKAIAELAAKAVPSDLAQHDGVPEDCDCGGEDAGYWCDAQPGKPTTPFWVFEYYDIENLRPDDEDETAPTTETPGGDR